MPVAPSVPDAEGGEEPVGGGEPQPGQRGEDQRAEGRNGATEVETWAVLAGKNPSALTAAGSQPRGGFETVISVNSEGPYFAVTAHDASGRRLGRSATVKRITA